MHFVVRGGAWSAAADRVDQSGRGMRDPPPRLGNPVHGFSLQIENSIHFSLTPGGRAPCVLVTRSAQKLLMIRPPHK